MEKVINALGAVFLFVLLQFSYSKELRVSEGDVLLQIQRVLQLPKWSNSTDYCNLKAASSLSVVCYNRRVSQLHIIGESERVLPKNFSVNSLFASLVYLPRLRVLTLSNLGVWGSLPSTVKRLQSLEIMNMSSNLISGALPAEFSSMSRLQSLVLDNNMLSGELPTWIDKLPFLTKLSLRNNKLNGTLPSSLSEMKNLRILGLSENNFVGDVPSLEGLTQLEILDLGSNNFGPKFPRIGSSLITLVLANNNFRSSIPQELNLNFQLRWLNLANNNFIGPFPKEVLSLPALAYLNISKNKLSGKLFVNETCGNKLRFVDISSNYLAGTLPECLVQRRKIIISYGNCLESTIEDQNPLAYCSNQALAVEILPPTTTKKSSNSKLFVIIGVLVGGVLLIALVFFVSRKANCLSFANQSPQRTIAEDAANGYTPKLFSEARYISKAIKIETFGLQPYRTFTIGELEEATNNFDSSGIIPVGTHEQMYKGRLKDGSNIAVRCLKIKRSQSTQIITNYVEIISKLRHRHLVSALGHCFEGYKDGSNESSMFLVFELVQNTDLRSWVSEGRTRTGQKLNWAQRISAAIGVAKGIQYLHTGIVPGIYSNTLKITDVLLDQNLAAKISCFNLPLLKESTSRLQNGGGNANGGSKFLGSSKDDKADVYDFGVILLEIILGRAVKSEKDVKNLREELQSTIDGSESKRRRIVDPGLDTSSSDQSLRTAIEICIQCLLDDEASRPSVEDVVWNLQFASQIQDESQGGTSNAASPTESM